MMPLVNETYMPLQTTAQRLKASYQQHYPFPAICLDDFFDMSFISRVASEFPDLANGPAASYKSPTEWKLASKGDSRFSPGAQQLAYFFHSLPFLQFLQELTGIEEALIPDPYFEGGGYHEIKSGGYLKIHADFNKHPITGLDRRLNVIVYLNDEWEENFGGHFELWDTDMKTCAERILPVLNRLVIFNTTSTSYHGHPDPLTCPPHRSRRSFAVYYYTNGRPAHEYPQGDNQHGTLFQARSGQKSDKSMARFTQTASFIKAVMPPFLFNAIRRMFIKE